MTDGCQAPICSDCAKPITKLSKTGRCRECAGKVSGRKAIESGRLKRLHETWVGSPEHRNQFATARDKAHRLPLTKQQIAVLEEGRKKGHRMPRTEKQRSQAMAALKSVQTPSKLEFVMKPYLATLGFIHQPQEDIPGLPDFWYPQFRIAVFADGCYWHGCPVCGYDEPDLETEKGIRVHHAMARDETNTERLHSQGIKVVRIWEHDWYADSEAVIRSLYAISKHNQPMQTARVG